MKEENDYIREKLAAEVKSMISDFEELLKATSGQSSNEIKSARSLVEKSLHSARIHLSGLEYTTARKIDDAATDFAG